MAEREALDQLRQLVEDDTDLYIGKPVDERILRLYLNYADYNVTKAFEKMNLVYRLKAENSEYYAHKRDPALHDVILQEGIHMLLDQRDQLGRRIYLLKLGNLTYGAHEPHEFFQTDDIWLTLAFDEEETQKNGLVFLMDLAGFPWKFLRYFTPHIIRVSTAKAENIPVRNVQYHVINAGLLLNTLVSLVFPFLSQATKEQVYFHKSKESLHAHISRSALPAEYGGEGPALDHEQLVRDFLDTRRERLTEMLSYGYTTRAKIKG